MKTVLYVAVNKESGHVMSGAKGQYAFGDSTTLKRSLGQNYGYSASKQGLTPKDLYDIHELIFDSSQETNLKPFVVKEIHGTDWNDQGRLEFMSEDLDFSIGSLSECPEDASLERDLNFAYSIEGAMRSAYEAGKAGRPYEYIQEDEEEEE